MCISVWLFTDELTRIIDSHPCCVAGDLFGRNVTGEEECFEEGKSVFNLTGSTGCSKVFYKCCKRYLPYGSQNPGCQLKINKMSKKRLSTQTVGWNYYVPNFFSSKEGLEMKRRENTRFGTLILHQHYKWGPISQNLGYLKRPFWSTCQPLNSVHVFSIRRPWYYMYYFSLFFGPCSWISSFSISNIPGISCINTSLSLDECTSSWTDLNTNSKAKLLHECFVF